MPKNSVTEAPSLSLCYALSTRDPILTRKVSKSDLENYSLDILESEQKNKKPAKTICEIALYYAKILTELKREEAKEFVLIAGKLCKAFKAPILIKELENMMKKVNFKKNDSSKKT